MSETKRFTRAEVAAHDAKNNAVFIIHNHVYDVKTFLDEHPGGHEVLVNVVGKDATEDFDDIGHSLDAKDLMKKYRIGELVDSEKTESRRRPQVSAVKIHEEESTLRSWAVPLVLGILATILYQYLLG